MRSIACLIIICCFVAASQQVCLAQKIKSGQQIVGLFLETYQDANFGMRLIGYLSSAGLPPYTELTTQLRKQYKKADAAERAAISYALASMTRKRQDIETFLSDFPKDFCTYNKIFEHAFEIELLLVSVLYFLRELAYEKQYYERAMHMFFVVKKNTKALNSLNIYDDNFVTKYFEKHKNTKYEFEYDAACVIRSRYGDISSLFVKKLLNLTESKDMSTRVASQRLTSLFNDFDRKNVNENFYSMTTTDEEDTLLSYFIKETKTYRENVRIKNDKAFIRKLLEFEKMTYKSPSETLVKSLIFDCTSSAPADAPCVDLKILRDNGINYFNTYEKEKSKELLR